MSAERIAFLESVERSLDIQVARLTKERDRWKALLDDVVGEQVADRMWYDPERSPQAPKP